MNPLLGALVLVLIGLLGARLSFTAARAPLGPRLIFSAGTHFLFLGFLLGSNGIGLLSAAVIDQLFPFLALGLGWIGLLFGLQLDLRKLRRFPPGFLLVALSQATLSFFLFLALGGLVLGGLSAAGAGVRVALLAAAATACISTPAGVALISNLFLVRGRVSRLLFFTASLDALVGILALQITYALYHPIAIAGGVVRFSGIEWLAAAAGLGVMFGVFFLWLTRPKPATEELVLFLLGLVVFAAGTALYLGLSPLFVATIAGAVVANLSPLRRRIFALLEAWEKPIYVILLIFAGALLQFTTWMVAPLAVGYVLVRGVAKVAAGYASGRLVARRLRAPPDLGLGLIPQGGISLAMAISVALTYGAAGFEGIAAVEVLFGTIVLGVVVSELFGPFLIRNLLRRAGEIHPRVERALAAAGTEGGDLVEDGAALAAQARRDRAARAREGKDT